MEGLPFAGSHPRVMTHHAFALSILRASGCGARVIELRAQRALIRQVLGQAGEEVKLVRQALTMVAKTKGSGSMPEPGSVEQTIFESYQQALHAMGAIDFEDMIVEAAAVLRQLATGRSAASGEDVARTVSIDALLLDEAQDTSASQLELLSLIAPVGTVSVTAVGDADQTIYSFRGSRPDMLQRIGSRWRMQITCLPTNYRCAGAILQAARQLIERSSLREASTPLLSPPNLVKAGSVSVRSFATRADEISALAAWLRGLQSTPGAGSIAVLCRTRAEVAEVTTALKTAGVRVTRQAEGGSAKGGARAVATDILAFLRMCVEPSDDDAFVAAMQIGKAPRTGFATSGAPANGLQYLRAVQQHLSLSSPHGVQVSLAAAASAAITRGCPSAPVASGPVLELTRPQQNALHAFLSDLRQTAADALTMSPSDLLESLATRVGLCEHVQRCTAKAAKTKACFHVRVPGETALDLNVGTSDDDDDDDDSNSECDAGRSRLASVSSNAVNSLLLTSKKIESEIMIEHAAPHAAPRASLQGPRAQAHKTLSRFADALTMADHDSAATGSDRDVLVTTFHQGKGLEWEMVAMPGMTEGSMPVGSWSQRCMRGRMDHDAYFPHSVLSLRSTFRVACSATR